MADKTTHTNSADNSTQADLHALRQATLDFGKALRAFGKSRISELGEDLGEDATDIAAEGQRLVHDVEHRLRRLEKRLEHSVRDHPGAWATGVLGVVGFGVALSLLFRSKSR